MTVLPPTFSDATGKASFTVTDGGKKMAYSLNATKIKGVTDVALLYSTANGTTSMINGPLVQSSFTSSSILKGVTGLKSISDLVKDMLDGKIFMRISTVKFPLNEIAGKVTPAT